MDLKAYVRDIPDFPQPGILFKDITPILSHTAAFKYVVDQLAERYRNQGIDCIVAIEARGFLFGAPMAYQLGVGLVPVRKEGKLPYQSLREAYSLEYGTSVMEVHSDGIRPGQRVLVVDDLLATGGTLAATTKLVEQAGGKVAALAVVLELLGLEGRKLLAGYEVFSLVQYEGR